MGSYFTDLSSNNGGFNAAMYKSSGARPIAVMLKATEGFNYVNPFYRAWVHDAHRHGLAVFHYHFCRPELGGATEQADHFASVFRPHFVRPGDYVVADLETGEPRASAAWLRIFDERLIARHAVHPWCYTGASFLIEGGVTVRSNRYHVAAWGSRRPGNFRWRIGNREMVAWQFTDGQGFGTGPQRIPGVPGPTDGSFLSPSMTRSINNQLHRRRKGK